MDAPPLLTLAIHFALTALSRRAYDGVNHPDAPVVLLAVIAVLLNHFTWPSTKA